MPRRTPEEKRFLEMYNLFNAIGQKNASVRSCQPIEEKRQMSPEELAERNRNFQKIIDEANEMCRHIPTEVVKKKKKDPERQALQKNFAPFTNLETEAMKKIQTQVDKYIADEKGDKHGLQMLRFINRKEILKILLIGIAELRAKGLQPMNQLETFVINPTVDTYTFVAVLANTVETHLFKTLYNSNVKSRDEPYQVKLKILKAQLNDKTNFNLRRGMINKTITYEFLEKASEDDLKSEERKEDERRLMERLVRQSQSWEDIDRQGKKIKEDTEDAEAERIEEVNVESEHEDEPLQETAEVKALKEGYSNAFKAIQQCKLEMKKRLDSLGGPQGKRLLKNWQTVVQRK